MAFPTQPASTDLLLPLPSPGEHWDPHLIHTHYFGFSIPEEQIGAFIYIRYHPAFPLSQGGVCIFQGTDNVSHADAAYLDYQTTMPWPTIEGNTVTTDNGLRIEFVELGRSARITYQSSDARTSVDVLAEAVTPLLARGHVMPGEENHHGVGSQAGGSEQFMHVTGELVLDGASFAVDCHAVRDRSWHQVRAESYYPTPPIGWSPMYFGPDLIFNQISFEPLDTDPAWMGLYEVGDRPTHHFAWIQRGEDTLSIKWVRRDVLEYHPRNHLPMRQDITAEDERGERYRFRGQAIACAAVPQWPNASFHDSVYRWVDDQGRITHSAYQELWMPDYQRMMRRRSIVTSEH